jgi:hypothetical protein
MAPIAGGLSSVLIAMLAALAPSAGVTAIPTSRAVTEHPAFKATLLVPMDLPVGNATVFLASIGT